MEEPLGSLISWDQPPITIAYLGPPSSYSHQAALHEFGGHNTTLVPYKTFKDVFDAVQSDESKTTWGIVPYENSINGSVIPVLDLLAEHETKYDDIYVCAEAYLPVHHFLLGSHHRWSKEWEGPDTVPRGQPLTDLDKVTVVLSHSQALGQCDQWLSTHLPDVVRRETQSTAEAAEEVSKDATEQLACISSESSARKYKLDIMAGQIEDSENNETRFLLLGAGYDSTRPFLEELGENDEYRTLATFTVDSTQKDLLADILAEFKKHKLSLINVNSRPSRVGNWNYRFYLEFEGYDCEGVGWEVKSSIQHLTAEYRHLGSFRSRAGP